MKTRLPDILQVASIPLRYDVVLTEDRPHAAVIFLELRNSVLPRLISFTVSETRVDTFIRGILAVLPKPER